MILAWLATPVASAASCSTINRTLLRYYLAGAFELGNSSAKHIAKCFMRCYWQRSHTVWCMNKTETDVFLKSLLPYSVKSVIRV